MKILLAAIIPLSLGACSQVTAVEQIEQCVLDKARGTNWRASSGIPLETFCSLKIKLENLSAFCKSNPDKC